MREVVGSAQTKLHGSHVLCMPVSGVDKFANVTSDFPRRDLAKMVYVVYYAKDKNCFQMVRKLRSKHNPLYANVENCVKWLHFLKENHPLYKDVVIPETTAEKQTAQADIDKQVDVIIKASLTTDSTVTNLIELSHTDDISRAKLHFDAEANPDHIVNLGSSLVTSLPGLKETKTLMFRSLQEQLYGADEQKPTPPPEHNITFEGTLVNEMENNPESISGAFPWLFPYGLDAARLESTGSVRKLVVRSWMRFYDKRFSRSLRLPFLRSEYAS